MNVDPSFLFPRPIRDIRSPLLDAGIPLLRRFRSPPMKTLLRSLLLVGLIVLLSATGRATSVASETDHCPFCGHDYLIQVLQSWNNFDGQTGPPQMPPSSCPFCLIVWTGDPPSSLTKEQRKALRAALESWPQELSEAERQKLLRELDVEYSGVPERIDAALQMRCSAALKGESLPKFVIKPKTVGKSSDKWNRKDRERILEALPRLVALLKQGKEVVSKPENKSQSADYVTLDQVKTAIANGNALAFEYFVRWTLAADDATLCRGEGSVRRYFGDILFEVARSKKLPWPKGVDSGKARSVFAANALRYAYQPEQRLDDVLKDALRFSTKPYVDKYEALARAGKEEEAKRLPAPFFHKGEIVMKAAAGKKDREAGRFVSSLPPAVMEEYGDGVELYYERCGDVEDLPFLEKCGVYAMKEFKSAKKKGEDDGWIYDDFFSALALTRMRSQLMGKSVSFPSAK